jgi:hypothetical protein
MNFMSNGEKLKKPEETNENENSSEKTFSVKKENDE